MARPSPFHPNGFRLSPQTQNPYGVTKASPAETYTKTQHETDLVQSAKFVNFGKGSMLRSKIVGRASVLASRLEACQFLQNAAIGVNDACQLNPL